MSEVDWIERMILDEDVAGLLRGCEGWCACNGRCKEPGGECGAAKNSRDIRRRVYYAWLVRGRVVRIPPSKLELR